MSAGQQQLFGGDWTQDKLRAVKKYLDAYVRVMKNQPYFETSYIDAFAGTGSVTMRLSSDDAQLALPELAAEGVRRYLVGSARQALEVVPPFSQYVFIEQDSDNVARLEQMTRCFPDLSDRILVTRDDANRRVRAICDEWDWRKNRAVLFLDPFGMQVDWSTIEAIARTQAIDLWYLFPVGAVCRCMPRGERPIPAWEDRLDRTLGTREWRDLFYEVSRRETLLGEESSLQRTADYRGVFAFFMERLKQVFADVAAADDPLCNGRQSPMFFLFFAVANPSAKAREAAMKIAGHILRMKD